MAYATGAETNSADLLIALEAFAVANGWTADLSHDAANNWLALTKGSCSVQFYYDALGKIAIFQSGSYDGSDPGSNPEDSGNTAQTSGTITKGHRVDLRADSGWVSRHFFEQDSGPAYIWVAVEVQAGSWRYFGFGEIEKLGDWTGGAFAIAQFITADSNAPTGRHIDRPKASSLLGVVPPRWGSDRGKIHVPGAHAPG